VPPTLDELQTAIGSSYRLERELGRGGMATVYLARDTKHARFVPLRGTPRFERLTSARPIS